MTETIDIEQRSPEWFSARRGLITASSIGAILGCDPFRSRDDVMRQMVRDWHGLPSEYVDNPATMHGTHYEQAAINALAEKIGVEIKHIGFIRSENDWAGCSPDGYIVVNKREPVGVEIKCPYGKRKASCVAELDDIENLPHYYAQVQFSMWVTGWKGWIFAQYVPPGEHNQGQPLLKQVCVDPDPAWRDKNVPIIEKFRDEFYKERVKNDSPYLKDKALDLTEDRELWQMIADYQDILHREKDLKTTKDQLVTAIAERCNNRNAVCGSFRITKVQREGSVSYARVVKEHCPDVDLEEYRGKPTEYWKITA